MSQRISRLAIFDNFVFNMAERTLTRAGEAVQLQRRTAELLLYLIENQNTWISNEELLQNVWPDARVSADNIYHQIAAVRRALGDPAKDSRYVQTKYRYGCRFIGDVELKTEVKSDLEGESPPGDESLPAGIGRVDVNSLDIPSSKSDAPPGPPTERADSARKRNVYLGAAVVIACCIVALLWARRSFEPRARITEMVRLTMDGQPKVGPLVTDGIRIYFQDGKRIQGSIMSIPVSGGEAKTLEIPLRNLALRDISSDGATLFLLSYDHNVGEFWDYSIPARKLRLLRSGVYDASVSRDGKSVAYSTGHDLRVGETKGGMKMPIDLRGTPGFLQWSPNGQFVRFSLVDFPGAFPTSLWDFSVAENVARQRVGPSPDGSFFASGTWSREGRSYFYIRSGGDSGELWVTSADSDGAGEALTSSSPGGWAWPVSSKSDNRTIFAIHQYTYPELVRMDLASGVWSPVWKGIPAFELSYSNDGKWVVYTKLPDYSIWKANSDGSERVPLVQGGHKAHQPHWAPDGSSIAYMGENDQKEWQIFEVPAKGGKPKILADGADAGVPTWSPDGTSLIFGERLTIKDRSKMVIHIVDLRTSKVSEMQGSQGLWSPRWSPDGRYILALSTDSTALKLRSLPYTEWKRFASFENIDNATWSSNSQYIYFNAVEENRHRALFRVAIASSAIERLADLNDFRSAQEDWFGVDRDGNPLAFRETSLSDIFRLKCDVP